MAPARSKSLLRRDCSSTAREAVAEVHEADEKYTNDAVAAAKAAFPVWRDLDLQERGVYLSKLASLIREANDELARLEAISTGKPISRFNDAMVAADNFQYFAAAGFDAQGTTSLNTRNHLNITVKQPYGVVGCIIPWNAPLIFFSLKVAPALAAGNTVVLKSSEKAPLTCAYVVTLVQKAGFPPGVLNIITGFGEPTGATIASHMDVRAVSFTGSLCTGRKIQAAAAASNMENVILELGGKSPAIIFEDADLESAATQTQFSIRYLSGQMCMANSRIYVQESVAEKFLALFKEKFGAARLGDPLDEKTDHGPQVDELQYNRNVPEQSRLVKEEVFGPVVVINTFKTKEEAIAKANDTEYGLYAAVFTKNIDRAIRVSKLIEAGVVAVNCTSPTTGKDMPSGGFKSSGVGRKGLKCSLDNYLETKAILIRISPE
ncbi:Aldehyde/histidinol dehydrogenase [Thermoascus aurantiacus ATCC 26904]